MKAIQTILHPTDFSESSRHAFELACSLARDRGARLIVLHVMPQPLFIPSGVMTPPPPPPSLEEREELKKHLLSIRADDPAIRLEHRFEIGDPVAGILAVARDESCDLIVMGTHGRRGLSRILMGSVAEEVLRKAPCPVLAVKVPVAVEEPRQPAVSEAST